MHHGLVKVLRGIIEEAGVPKATIVEEARGLRPGDVSRPGDIVVLDFSDDGRHLVIDGVVTTVYRISVLDKVASIPGYVAKLVEERKFKKDADSPQPDATAAGGRHTFVPFAMEDGGRLGAHAHATLNLLAK